MKVLITGGTGFVGSHSVKALKDAGHHIRLLVRSERKAHNVLSALGTSADEIIQGDVTDKASVEKAVAGCDAIIHSAAMVATTEKFAQQLHETNVVGTQNVIDASLAAGIKKIIYVSSVSAIFNLGDDTMHENSPISTAQNPYGRTKVACEKYVRQLQAEGAPIVITYPAGIVGSHDPGLSEPHFGIKLFVGIVTFTSSTGMQFVNVKDIARAHLAILETMTGPDRFILGGCYYSWQDLLNITKKLTGRRLIYVHIPGSLLRLFGKLADVIIKYADIELPITGEGMSYATQWVYADSSKIEKELGIKFTDREETLAEVISWLYQTGHLSKRQAGKVVK